MELTDLKKQITEILIDFDSFREADINSFVNDIVEKCDIYYGEKINNLQFELDYMRDDKKAMLSDMHKMQDMIP